MRLTCRPIKPLQRTSSISYQTSTRNRLFMKLASNIHCGIGQKLEWIVSVMYLEALLSVD